MHTEKFSSSTEFGLTETQQLDRIITLLERIAYHQDPPFWKKVVKYIFTHLFAIISLFFIAYVTWKIWGIVNSIEGSMTGIYDYMVVQYDKLKSLDFNPFD